LFAWGGVRRAMAKSYFGNPNLYLGKPNFSDGLVTGIFGVARRRLAGFRKDFFYWGAFAGLWLSPISAIQTYFGLPPTTR
jgi:hypothetical protein